MEQIKLTYSSGVTSISFVWAVLKQGVGKQESAEKSQSRVGDTCGLTKRDRVHVMKSACDTTIIAVSTSAGVSHSGLI